MAVAAASASPGPERAPELENTKIGPQNGPQRKFFLIEADIAIYGGAAGGGKTWALLLEAVRHRKEPDFAAVVFRRTTVQVRNPGGLWDESLKLYAGSGGEPFSATLEWRFPSGAKVKFAHLEHEKTVLEWQGAQLPLICFDELKWFGQEARLATAWIDKSVPGAQQTLALLFQAADQAAATLEGHASAGFSDIVANAIDEAGGTIANLISASGLDLTSKAILTAADVATVTAAQSIAHNAISVATAKLLGQTAQIAAGHADAPAPAASRASTAPAQHLAD